MSTLLRLSDGYLRQAHSYLVMLVPTHKHSLGKTR